jgi:hypothetical protein
VPHIAPTANARSMGTKIQNMGRVFLIAVD